MDAFLKMIDDLQTPKHKTNHIKYRRCFPQYERALIKVNLLRISCQHSSWLISKFLIL